MVLKARLGTVGADRPRDYASLDFAVQPDTGLDDPAHESDQSNQKYLDGRNGGGKIQGEYQSGGEDGDEGSGAAVEGNDSVDALLVSCFSFIQQYNQVRA